MGEEGGGGKEIVTKCLNDRSREGPGGGRETVMKILNDQSSRKIVLEGRKTLTFSSPASRSVCKFSLHYPHKISFMVMIIKQMIIHRNLYIKYEKQNSPDLFARKL